MNFQRIMTSDPIERAVQSDMTIEVNVITDWHCAEKLARATDKSLNFSQYPVRSNSGFLQATAKMPAFSTLLSVGHLPLVRLLQELF